MLLSKLLTCRGKSLMVCHLQDFHLSYLNYMETLLASSKEMSGVDISRLGPQARTSAEIISNSSLFGN